jgi:hypothetical protein
MAVPFPSDTPMRTKTMAIETVFDNGLSGDSRWLIERDEDTGQLYLTSNAMTREAVTPQLYNDWTGEMLDRLREGLGVAGVDDQIADAFLRQAQIYM